MRSNRQISQFAVDMVRDFISDLSAGTAGHFSRTKGNTKVELTDFGHGSYSVSVYLFNRPILVLGLHKHQVEEIIVWSGGYYDRSGNPTRTTRERLNALLDALGEDRIIPQGIRVFNLEEETVVGGSVQDEFKAKPLRFDHPSARILANSETLIFGN